MRWLISLLTLIVLVSTASAQEAGIGLSSQDAWEGDAINIACWFSEEPGGEVRATIDQPIIVEIGLSQDDATHFSADYLPPVTGAYSISCGNGSMESGEASFTVSSMEVDITGYPDQAFTDQGVEIEATVIKAGDGENHVTSGVEFSASIDGEDIGISGPPYFISDHWVISTPSMDGIGAGSHALRIGASYDGRYDWDEVFLDVAGPLEFGIASVSPDELQGSENVTVELDAYYHGIAVLQDSSLTATLDGEGLSIRKTQSGFTFTCPGLEPSPHTLEVGIDYNGLSGHDSSPIYYMIPVNGELEDADEKGISASIRFVGDGIEKSIRSNVNGEFSGSIPAGTYTIEMDFPDDVAVSADDIGIDQELSDFVRFDAFKAGEIDGMKVAKAFALEFSPDFDTMVIRAGYDGSVVSDESEIAVYACEDWNLDTRSCLGSWDGIDFEIDTMQNEVEFEPDHLSGFVIGKRKELYLEMSMDRKEYLTGQDMKISGVVKDDDGNTVHDARVSYDIDGGVDGSVSTNTNGVFTINIPAPSRGGDYTILVKASMGFSEKDSGSMGFSVLSVTDFTIIPPLKVEVTEGSGSEVEVMIVNTGQETLEDFKISLSGIPEEWYQADPARWELLLPDEQKTVVLDIRPDSAGQEVYTVSVDVECSGASKSESFVLYVSALREEKESEAIIAVADPGQDMPSFDSVTTYLVGSYEALVNTISLLVSGGIMLLIFRRLRSGRPAAGSRTWLMAMLDAVRSEVSGPPVKYGTARKKGKSMKRKSDSGSKQQRRHIEIEV